MGNRSIQNVAGVGLASAVGGDRGGAGGREGKEQASRRNAEKRGFHHGVSSGEQRERRIGRQDAKVEILRPGTARAQDDRSLEAACAKTALRNSNCAAPGGLLMLRRLSDQEFHAHYCALKNTKSALFLVACFSLTTFVNLKGLHKARGQPDFVVLLFAILVAGMLAKWLVAFTCIRERLILGLVIVSIVAAEVETFVPSIVGPHLEAVRSGHFSASLLALLVSLSMLVKPAGKAGAS